MADDELRVLGDRYEIHRRLARGGMAQVYLARDRSLDRPVAVKELVPEFATDPSFVERFRREAQAAANLSHPNIVGVYDWGTQDGTYFIVMEYVDGPSLSQVIRRDGPLHPRRAAEIAGEVAAALGSAHSRGVVHRDIKPGNVLLTSNGQAKVTDFGIARALSSADEDLTQAGSVMGTATYFSPEQAQGLPVDPRTDLYSLGVVLYEMVTGRPPFTGETPLAIAYKHVQDQPAPPSTVIPDLPVALEAVIMKLLAKRPDDRYASAEELRRDLGRFLAGEDTAAHKALAAAAVGAGVGAAAAATTVQRQVQGYSDDPDDELAEEPRSRTGVFLGVLVLLLVILAGLLFWFARSLNASDVEVPATIGLTRPEAEKVLTDEGFKVDVTEQANPTIEAGRVISQDPAPRTKAPEGSKVKLTVSTGPEKVSVPNVVGQAQLEAQNTLVAAGLKFRVESVENETVEPGTVVTQNPAAGEAVVKDTEILLQVSKGSGQELVPDVTGQTQSAAIAALQAAGFRIGGPQQQASDSVPSGRVISTNPPAGTSVKKNATVTVVVSTGPQQVTVPGVVGQTEDNATATLRNKGFDVSVTTKTVPAGDANVGRVTAQSPGGGSTAAKGSTVTITVGVAAATTTAPATSSTTTSTP
ncbi:MAG: Stk1 family PASTA domain-containing Ser/Thr kinase [Microthrixaceae bacterium]